MNKKKTLMGIAVLCVLIVLSMVAIFLFQKNKRDRSNLFEYVIDLKNENWTYAPRGLDYGMTAEEVIKAEQLKNYIWEEENEILRTEQTVKKLFGEIKEFEFVKRYFFDSEGGLASVRYELTLASEYEETIRQLLYDQAVAYMPENSRKTNLEDLLDFESLLLAMWNKVVVWEDTEYQEDTSEVLAYANSDVVLRVSRPEWYENEEKEIEQLIEERDVLVTLIVSRYEERLTQEQISEQREQYPICGVEFNPTICVSPFGLEQWLWQAETFVYGEVVGNEFSSESSQYEMSVIEDTEGMLPVDNMISTDYRQGMVDYELYPTDGMELVAMAAIATYKEEDEWYFDMHMPYYVTEDGYVLSTFDENEKLGGLGYRVAESALSGLKLEDLLRKLKK